MKYIKKIAVSPLPKHEGKIVDSFNVGVDEHKNAPSLNAVKEYVDGKFAVIGIDKEDISSSSTRLNYPDGFSVSNSAVIYACEISTEGMMVDYRVPYTDWELEKNGIILANIDIDHSYLLVLMRI